MLHSFQSRDYDRKLISSESRHGVRLAQRPGDGRPDLSQKEITDVMSEAVVDLLEAIEIDEQNGNRKI